MGVSLKGDVLTIKIFSDIGTNWWETSFEEIDNGISWYEDKFKDVDVFISSRGGSVVQGMAIRNSLLTLGLKGHAVNITIIGTAASIASVIALAGTTPPKMYIGSYLMIHNVKARVEGDDEDLENTAASIKKMKNDIATIYAESSNISKEDCLAYMKKETWFTAEEAESFNFAEKVIIPKTDSETPVNLATNMSANNSMLTNCYKNDPFNLAPSTNPPGNTEEIDNNENPINSVPLEPVTKGVPMAMSKKEFEAFCKTNPEAAAFYAENGGGEQAPSNGGGDGNTAAAPVAQVEEPVNQVAETAKAQAKSVLASDAYPKNIRSQAGDFLAGDTNETVFLAALGAHDAVIEAMNSNGAQNLSSEIAETPAAIAAAKKKEEEGLISSNEDIDNLVAEEF